MTTEADAVIATEIALLNAADGRLAHPHDIFTMVDAEAIAQQVIGDDGKPDKATIERLVLRARDRFGGKWRPLTERARAQARRSPIRVAPKVIEGGKADDRGFGRAWSAAAKRHGLAPKSQSGTDRAWAEAVRRAGGVTPGGDDAA